MVAEKSGFSPDGAGPAPASLEEYAERMTRDAIEVLPEPAKA